MAGPLAPTPGTTITRAAERPPRVRATRLGADAVSSALRMLTRLPAP